MTQGPATFPVERWGPSDRRVGALEGGMPSEGCGAAGNTIQGWARGAKPADGGVSPTDRPVIDESEGSQAV